MKIQQFEDKNLSHFSYAILSESVKEIVLIDPARNPQPYIDFAAANGGKITSIIQTHPHADFVSSHLELHEITGAVIYNSKLTGAKYPHQPFDDGDDLQVGNLHLSAINTPGHSPDSISILLEHHRSQKAVFTGDTLFIGDCGRPDLREDGDDIQTSRNELARQMYYSLRERLMILDDNVVVYPAHGAGTLCGKSLSSDSTSTIAKEKKENWSLQPATEAEFVENLLADQPFVPLYFPFDVALNRLGATGFKSSISTIQTTENLQPDFYAGLNKSLWIVDTRKEHDYKEGHLPHSINLMEDGKFETWLGSIIPPNEAFYLAGENKQQLQRMLERTAAIGYETAIAQAFILKDGPVKEAEIDINLFKNNQDHYTIVDVRNTPETKENKIFNDSIAIPLHELRNRLNEIPVDKPIVVHCAGGYRSAAGSSLISAELNGAINVFDLGESIKQFE